MAQRASLLVAALSAACAAGAVPPNGLIDGIFSLQDSAYALRHCNYVASACPADLGSQDFQFTLVNALNAAGGDARSFRSVNFPTYYLSVVNATAGTVGVLENPDVDDASWLVTAPLNGASLPSAASLQSLSKGAAAGLYASYGTSNNAPCHYSSPSGDILLLPAGAIGASRQSWSMGVAPPANTSTWTVDGSAITNPAVNRRFMGCHHDYGFAQAPRGYSANLIYGSQFEAGTCSVPSWQPSLEPAGTPGRVDTAEASAFSGNPSMEIDMDKGAAVGARVGLINRGIGYAGLSLQGGKTYEVELWLWTGGATTAFVELRDYTTTGGPTSLARQDFSVQTTGPDWGSTWFRYTLNLTTTAGTQCEGITPGSDPAIDCGNIAGPAHVCVRCGGEIYVGLSAPGNIKIGYNTLMPGAWGRLSAKDGTPLPVLASAAADLSNMGVSVIRSGGSVSQGMRWKDWRGPAWNRPSVQHIWGESDFAGWGPFEVIDMCAALDIEPIITLAYDLNDPLDFADLVEYAWGDPATTSWGARRAADGHPAVYNVSVFELGNEQYNPNWVDQVAAMEARAKAIGVPVPLQYMFPQNGGLNAQDAARVLAIGGADLASRTLPDLHVGAGGAVEAAAQLFASPVVNGFNSGAINCETNAGTHDHARGLAEAADLIDFFTAPTNVTNRIYARTASFCNGASAQFDSWDQGIVFFLPNMTWLQPPGWVHVMIKNTWAETTLSASNTGGPSLPFAAQRTADGKSLVLRVVTGAAAQPLSVSFTGGLAAAGPSYTLWTLSGLPSDDNTPGEPLKVSPVQSTVPIAAGATSVTASLASNTFAIMVIALQ